jgi:hypothetical protein
VTPPPRDAFAATVRRALDMHDEWDAPHSFETLHWDGTKLTTMTYACIMTDIKPSDYPAYMMALAREELEKHPEDPAYGYLLQAEGHRVTEPGPEASAAEREQFQRDRREREVLAAGHLRLPAGRTVDRRAARHRGDDRDLVPRDARLPPPGPELTWAFPAWSRWIAAGLPCWPAGSPAGSGGGCG